MREIKTVLSLDCDVLINGHTFAKYINHDLSAGLNWKLLHLIKQEVNTIDTDCCAESLGKMVAVLKRKCGNAIVRVIEEHDEIVPLMEDLGVSGATMYNFDAHHDLNYGNNNSELTIENWVLHARNKGQISDYHWIHRTLSDLECESPIQYTRTNLFDLDIDKVADVDLVVICVSKHFTPEKYWKALPNVLLESLSPKLLQFKEKHPRALDLKKLEGMDDYLIDGTMPNVDRLFVDDQLYMIVEEDGNGASLSMVSFGGKSNLFKCKSLVEFLLEEYEFVRFDFKPGIRNELFISRLASQLNVTEAGEGYYIIKRKVL